MSDLWQWIFAIIGLVAFLMAIQPFVAHIWGAPKISIDFSEDDRGDVRFLRCEIKNEPILKGVLALLRIRRETASDVIAALEINERETGILVYKRSLVEMSNWTGMKGQRVSLPASLLGSHFAIVGVEKERGTVKIVNEDEQKLLPGRYMVAVHVNAGAKKYKVQRSLTISRDFPFAYWDVSS